MPHWRDPGPMSLLGVGLAFASALAACGAAERQRYSGSFCCLSRLGWITALLLALLSWAGWIAAEGWTAGSAATLMALAAGSVAWPFARLLVRPAPLRDRRARPVG